LHGFLTIQEHPQGKKIITADAKPKKMGYPMENSIHPVEPSWIFIGNSSGNAGGKKNHE
jgi:hypothetical protein